MLIYYYSNVLNFLISLFIVRQWHCYCKHGRPRSTTTPISAPKGGSCWLRAYLGTLLYYCCSGCSGCSAGSTSEIIMLVCMSAPFCGIYWYDRVSLTTGKLLVCSSLPLYWGTCFYDRVSPCIYYPRTMMITMIRGPHRRDRDQRYTMTLSCMALYN